MGLTFYTNFNDNISFVPLRFFKIVIALERKAPLMEPTNYPVVVSNMTFQPTCPCLNRAALAQVFTHSLFLYPSFSLSRWSRLTSPKCWSVDFPKLRALAP